MMPRGRCPRSHRGAGHRGGRGGVSSQIEPEAFFRQGQVGIARRHGWQRGEVVALVGRMAEVVVRERIASGVAVGIARVAQPQVIQSEAVRCRLIQRIAAAIVDGHLRPVGIGSGHRRQIGEVGQIGDGVALLR
ncbi:hypothetical protein WR25_26009 [Diploscapter pachys]|uniref:Uncharacterized protein n=1 Tax=Diploscapter pachys TaxID=2018661 RepID=A0A2A2K4V6_9BILA|nr:hypothetical protein WR25_26009 [Diploscapter pachys]